MIIIGIDPGSRYTGYGVIRSEGATLHYIASGYLHVQNLETHERLQHIFSGLQEVVRQFQPEEAAIEQIFMHQNPNSALKLGQARGAAIVALGLRVAEYSARRVKQAVVGFGAATKEQVQHMVKALLRLSEKLQADEADALAIALCHAHSRFSLPQRSVRRRSSSWRNYSKEIG